MKILDVLFKETIIIDLKSNDKISVLEELAFPISQIFNINCKEIVNVLMEREKLGTTGIGSGIGIPHCKLKNIKKLIIGFGRSIKGVDFDAIDKKLVHLFFIIIAPDNSSGIHLKILAQIYRIFKNDIFKERLLYVTEIDEIYNIIKEEDKEF